MAESVTSTIVQANAIADPVAIADAKPNGTATVVEDAKVHNEKRAGPTTKRLYSHTFPVHTKTVPSPLSKEAPPESYRGFVNLGSKYL